MIPVSFAGRLAGQSLARLVLVLGALILGGVAAATPLDLKAIPADAVWLAHLDMDAARDSSVMQRGWERAVRMHPQLDGMLRMGAGMMGLNPRTDLRDVTLFGLDTDKRNGVMIVRAKCDRPLLEKMAAKAPDHATMQHRSYTLHSWTHKGWKKGTGEPVVGAFFSDDVMVFAATDARVRMALDVLDGTGPALGGDAALAGRTRPGSIVVARARAIAVGTSPGAVKLSLFRARRRLATVITTGCLLALAVIPAARTGSWRSTPPAAPVGAKTVPVAIHLLPTPTDLHEALLVQGSALAAGALGLPSWHEVAGFASLDGVSSLNSSLHGSAALDRTFEAESESAVGIP
jgi:hypothetical protein